MYKNKTSFQIEKLKEELNKLLKKEGGNITKEILKKSRELDKVLNEYLRHLM